VNEDFKYGRFLVYSLGNKGRKYPGRVISPVKWGILIPGNGELCPAVLSLIKENNLSL
jgi:hypothetical protein